MLPDEFEIVYQRQWHWVQISHGREGNQELVGFMSATLRQYILGYKGFCQNLCCLHEGLSSLLRSQLL